MGSMKKKSSVMMAKSAARAAGPEPPNQALTSTARTKKGVVAPWTARRGNVSRTAAAIVASERAYRRRSDLRNGGIIPSSSYDVPLGTGRSQDSLDIYTGWARAFPNRGKEVVQCTSVAYLWY